MYKATRKKYNVTSLNNDGESNGILVMVMVTGKNWTPGNGLHGEVSAILYSLSQQGKLKPQLLQPRSWCSIKSGATLMSGAK